MDLFTYLKQILKLTQWNFAPNSQKTRLIFPLKFSEVYYWAGVSAEDFQRELEYQLSKTTLGISVGLVKQGGSNSSSLYPGASPSQLVNPYVHFGDEESKIQGTQDDDGMFLKVMKIWLKIFLRHQNHAQLLKTFRPVKNQGCKNQAKRYCFIANGENRNKFE